jgi:hypothetical protein
VLTPQLALSRQASGPPSTKKARTSRSRVSGFGKLAKRPISRAPSAACSAAPTPITAATHSGSSSGPPGSKLVLMLARNEPSQTPGQWRHPSASSAPSEMPDGGQTAVA